MVVARKRSRHLVQGHSNRELWLRVVGSQRDGQVIRLTSPKCTIGSARGCTLRLRAAGVRPIHCLILRGAQGTVVRTCPAGARLNGQEFLDSAIIAGDQLQLGPITLEVVAAGEAGSTDVTEAVERVKSDAELEDEAVRAERVRITRQRARKLVQAVRTVRNEMAVLRQQSAQEQAIREEQDLDRLRLAEEHQQLNADWHSQRWQWESEREQDRAERDHHKSQLERRESELAAEAERLRAERELWEQAQHALAGQREIEQQSLVAERQSLASLQESLQRDRTAFEQQQRDRYDQIDEGDAQLERSRQELAELRQQLEAQHREWECQRTEFEQAHASGHDEIERLKTMLTKDRQTWCELQQEQEARLKSEVAQMQSERDELSQKQGELQAAQCDLERRSQDVANREEQSQALQKEFQERQAELEALAAQLAAEQGTLAESASQHEQHRSEVQEAQSGLEQAREELERAHHALDRTRAEVEHDRGQLHERQARLAEERAEFEAEQLVLAESRAELARSQAEIAAGFEQLLQGHEALESARQQFGDRERILADREGSISEHLADVHSRRAAWAIELAAWESIQATAPQPTETGVQENQSAALADLQTQLSEARECVADHERQLDESLNQCASLSAELDQLRSEFERQQAAFADQRAAWDEERQALASRDAGDDSRGKDVAAQSDHEIESLGSSFGEQQREQPFDEEATVKMEVSDPAPETSEQIDDEEYDDAEGGCLPDSGAASETDEDKSIEECFEELLNRYRTQGTEPAPAAPVKRSKRKPDVKAAKPKQAEPAQPAPMNLNATVEIPVVDLMHPPAEIQRRSSGETLNFDAMREVAVSHANLAIGEHGRKRLLRAALVTSSAAVGAVFVTLIFLGGLAHHYTGLRTLANVGWVLAIFWAFVAGKAWLQVLAAKRAEAEGLRENLERLGRKKPGE